jgi:deoxycytidylate deaminase
MIITDKYNHCFMMIAKKIADNNTARWKIGAVLSRGNKILARGTNLKKTHPTFGSGHYQYLHAEGYVLWLATRRGYDLNNTVIYVYRHNNNLAKPCTDCQKMLSKYNITSFYSPIELNK